MNNILRWKREGTGEAVESVFCDACMEVYFAESDEFELVGSSKEDCENACDYEPPLA